VDTITSEQHISRICRSIVKRDAHTFIALHNITEPLVEVNRDPSLLHRFLQDIHQIRALDAHVPETGLLSCPADKVLLDHDVPLQGMQCHIRAGEAAGCYFLVGAEAMQETEAVGQDADGAAQGGGLCSKLINRDLDIRLLVQTQSSCKACRAGTDDDCLEVDKSQSYVIFIPKSERVMWYLSTLGHVG
jgi:hypothetical protein